MTWMSPLSRLSRFDDRRENLVHEADVPAEPAQPEEDPRLPRAHEDEGRTEGPQAAARERAETADGVGGRFPRSERLTTSAEIQALFTHGKRIERPSLVVLWRPSPRRRRVGFAVSRRIGGAARRNRARRRLREAYRAARGAAPEQVDLVVIARLGTLERPFDTLAEDLKSALQAIRGAER